MLFGFTGMEIVMGAAIIFTFLCFASALGMYLGRGQTNLVTTRMRQLSKVEEELKDELRHTLGEKETKERKSVILGAVDVTSVLSRVTGEAYFSNLEKTLAQADIPLKVSEFMTLRLILAAMIFGLAIIIWKIPLGLVLGLAGILLYWFIEFLVISFLKKRRINKFSNQLAEFLILIVNSLRAGQTFMQGCMIASSESPNPIAVEFKQVIKEVNLGMQESDALENLLERVPSEDLKIVVSGYVIQRRVGGNLAEILETTAHTIRERIKIQGLINTLTTQGKLSGVIVAGLPFVIGTVINLINHGYMEPLLSHPFGKGLIGVALIMQITGALVIKKIVSIEV